MKVLVVGCGSIGRRHIQNLLALEEIKSLYVLTSVENCANLFGNPKKLTQIESTKEVDPDFAIVANDTQKHVKTALELASRGVHVLIEKPLSHSTAGVQELIQVVSDKKIKAGVAYNMRFMPAIKYVKEILDKGVLGKLYFARIEAGQYLPDWRPDRDYRKTYSGDKKRGGGVALDLSHELDYMTYLFGDPETWRVNKKKVSDLEIDCEDLFEGLFQYSGEFLCSVHLDYLQPEKQRNLKIVGSKGTLTCDFVKHEIVLSGENGRKVKKGKSLFDIDKTYIDELSDFISIIKHSGEPPVRLEEGFKLLNLINDSNV